MKREGEKQGVCEGERDRGRERERERESADIIELSVGGFNHSCAGDEG